MKLGTLEFMNAAEHPELLAAPVAAALSSLPESGDIGVAPIDPALSDTAAFCERYQIGPELAANCVILRARKGEAERMVACVILATTRVDVNGTVRRLVDTKKISFAPMEKAVEGSAMEFGAITPVGLPADWPIYIDAAVLEPEQVIIGSGIRSSKIAIPGKVLAMLPNAQVIEGLAQVKAPQE